MKIIYVPMNRAYQVTDATNIRMPGWMDLATAKRMGDAHLINPVIVVLAEYDVDKAGRPDKKRLLLGFVDDLWIPGEPDEDGDYYVKLGNNEQYVFERYQGHWRDSFHGNVDDLGIVGYRPLLP
jgi:hypothetical protein